MYCIDPGSDEPIMLINKHIGYDAKDGMGIDGSLFQQELLALDGAGKKRIQVWINSPGGVVMDGYNIVNAILKSRTKVDTYCVGCAASIAGVIFQTGRRRYMADYSWLMYHMPFGGTDAGLDIIADSLVTMISSRSGQPEGFVTGMMMRETFISADEAMSMGFCDEIEASEDYNKKRLVNADSVQAKWEAANLILNSALGQIQFPKINSTSMSSLKRITDKLGLSADASEDSILAAITDVQNKAKKDATTKKQEAEDALAEMEDQMKKLASDKKEKDEEFDALKAKYDKLKDEVEAGKAKAKKDAEAENKEMVQNYARLGRIKNEASVIDQWVATARALGRDATKAMIEALPLNKAGVTVTDTVINKLGDGEVLMNAQSQMARVQAGLNAKRNK